MGNSCGGGGEKTVHPNSSATPEKDAYKKRKQFNTLPENDKFEKSELDNFVLKVIPKSHACYFLLELVPGGELFGRLAKMPAGQISDSEARFYAACTVEALQHMHSRDIVYRDLKPENLLIDNMGYIKMIDFGFAKVRERRARPPRRHPLSSA